MHFEVWFLYSHVANLTCASDDESTEFFWNFLRTALNKNCNVVASPTSPVTTASSSSPASSSSSSAPPLAFHLVTASLSKPEVATHNFTANVTVFNEIGARLFEKGSVLYGIGVLKNQGYFWMGRHSKLQAVEILFLEDDCASESASWIRRHHLVFDLDDTLVFNPPLPFPNRCPLLQFVNQSPPHTIGSDPTDTPVKRPEVESFLDLVCKHFDDVRVCTLSMRDRALEVILHLDPHCTNLLKGASPEKVIVSREDMANAYPLHTQAKILAGVPPSQFKKTFEALGLAPESKFNTIIVDDRPSLWAANLQENVVPILGPDRTALLKNASYFNGDNGGMVGRQILTVLLNLVLKAEGAPQFSLPVETISLVPKTWASRTSPQDLNSSTTRASSPNRAVPTTPPRSPLSSTSVQQHSRLSASKDESVSASVVHAPRLRAKEPVSTLCFSPTRVATPKREVPSQRGALQRTATTPPRTSTPTRVAISQRTTASQRPTPAVAPTRVVSPQRAITPQRAMQRETLKSSEGNSQRAVSPLRAGPVVKSLRTLSSSTSSTASSLRAATPSSQQALVLFTSTEMKLQNSSTLRRALTPQRVSPSSAVKSLIPQRAMTPLGTRSSSTLLPQATSSFTAGPSRLTVGISTDRVRKSAAKKLIGFKSFESPPKAKPTVPKVSVCSLCSPISLTGSNFALPRSTPLKDTHHFPRCLPPSSIRF